MSNFFENLEDAWLSVRAGWQYIEPERDAVRDWLQNQSANVRRRFRAVRRRVQWTIRALGTLFFSFIVAAMFFPPRAIHAAVPAFILAFAGVLTWTLTTLWVIAGLAVIAVVPADAPFKIGELTGSLKKVVGGLVGAALFAIVVAISFATITLPADAVHRLLLLTIISLVFAAILFVRSWIRKLVLLAIGLAVIFFFGNDEERAKRIGEAKGIVGGSAQAANANFNPGLVCLDDARRGIELHHENDTAPFDVDVPTTPEGYGCSTLLGMPTLWGYRWRWMIVSKDPEFKLYFMTPDGQVSGPHGQGSIANTTLPSTFWIQGTKKGGKIHFWSSSVIEPTAIATAKAECTAEAKEVGFSGYGLVSLAIDEGGNVRDVKIVGPTGVAGLDAKVIEAAKKYRFSPATQNGRAIPFQISTLRIDTECK